MEFRTENKEVIDKLREPRLVRVAAALGLAASVLTGCGVESKDAGADTTVSAATTKAGLAPGECYYYLAGAYETEVDGEKKMIVRPVAEINGDKTGSGSECAGQVPSALNPDSDVSFFVLNRETDQLEQVPAPDDQVRTRLNGGSDAVSNDAIQAVGAEPGKGDQTNESGVLTSGVLGDGTSYPFACASLEDQAGMNLDEILAADADSVNCR